ncbi:hypothetical protein [Microbacterium sp. Se63.02b]|uniref:hypothetical protein n=1 Tax=Microbacterium sp. Se63.02b TaxID=2709304 RepID=UPI001FCED4FF|nr:hypothetical protein [Microbacterium sp. Se63.02b]
MSRIRIPVVVALAAAAVLGGIRLVLVQQAALARRRIGKPLGESPWMPIVSGGAPSTASRSSCCCSGIR